MTGQVLDAMGIGYAVFDEEWCIRHVNAATERMTATTGGELIGRNHWDAFPAMAGSDFERHYRRAVATGEVVVFEAYYPQPLDVWVEVRAIPYAGGLQVSYLDVSARHRAQQLSGRDQQRLEALSAVAFALLEADDITDLVAVLAVRGLAAVGADGGSVAVPDPAEPGVLLSSLTTSLGADSQAVYGRLPLSTALPACQAFTGGRRVLLPDLAASLAHSPLMEQVVTGTGAQAWASLPLRAGGEVIGVLTAGWRTPQAFDEEQLDLLETFAAQCAQALQRLTARDAEGAAAEHARRSAAQQAALVTIARALGDAAGEQDVLTVVATQGLTLLEASDSGLCLREPDGTRMRVLATDSVPGDLHAELQLLSPDLALPFVQTAVTGAAYYLRDREQALARFPAAESIVAILDLQAQASVPLYARGHLLGSLSMGFLRPRSWSQDEQNLVEAFAALTAQALDRIGARQAEHAATAQQALLVAAATALGLTQSEDDVFAVVTDKGVGLLGAFGAGMCLLEPGGRGVYTLATASISAEVRDPLQHLPADYPLPLVDTAMTGTAHFLRDRAEAAARFAAAEEHYTLGEVQASAQVPLMARGQLLGSLSLAFHHARDWPRADQDLVTALAVLTAQALERITSRAAERDANAEVARFSETLQRSLLTAPAELDHLQIAVRYAPAAAQAHVGGDWYDAFVTAAGTTTLVIGDVSGHDSRAAAAMGQLRNILRGIAYASGETPAGIVSVTDSAVRDLAVDATATVVIAQAEQSPAQAAAGLRSLRWSSAGHLPPLLITPDGAARYLHAKPDLLLGIDPNTHRADHEVVLEPGATVLLFTDGLIERRRVHLQHGLDWLAGAVAALAHLPVEELCDALLVQVGDRVEDDVALLAMRAPTVNQACPPLSGPLSALPAESQTMTAPAARNPAGDPAA